MKWSIFIVSTLMFITLISCEKFATYNEKVNNFVQDLKEGKVDAFDLPEFTQDDIAALLVYRNDKTVLHNFPNNPISSFLLTECTLGTYSLWMIEAIRLEANDSDLVHFGYPSLNPVFVLRTSSELKVADQAKAQNSAARVYWFWWHDHRGKALSSYSSIDPMAKTDFRWR